LLPLIRGRRSKGLMITKIIYAISFFRDEYISMSRVSRYRVRALMLLTHTSICYDVRRKE
jgi:hypothetical protein